MPRPRPLTNISSAVPPPSEQQLTPRTPHNGSRTSRAEQGFAKLQLSETNEADFEDLNDALQSAPLLASSSTARFSVHEGRERRSNAKASRRKNASDPAAVLALAISRVPLAIGILLAGILLILIVLSFTRPEALHRYVGAKAPQDLTGKLSITTSSPVSTPTPSSIHSSTGGRFISYENYSSFPLHPQDYLVECAKLHQGFMSHGDYWDIGPMGALDVVHHDEASSVTCSSTITYMLDGMVGLTADLALMAQAAALARERNRTFLIDDRYWNRGKWEDHFEDVRKLQPGPEPGCKPPPPNELVACPRTARHWIINSRTAKFHFGHGFSNHYEDPYAHQLNRLKPIFESSRDSLQSTIKPNPHNSELIDLTRRELAAVLEAKPAELRSYVAVHIRRGDRKPASYNFPNDKIPLQSFLDSSNEAWKRLHPKPGAQEFPVIYVASDSPHAVDKFSKAYDGEIFSLLDIGDPRLRALASPKEYHQDTFNKLDLNSRISLTRGMIVDLALISGLWPDGNALSLDATICSISSNVCKLAAVGLGWSRAFGNVDSMGNLDNAGKRWVEIDEKGQVTPIWHAFELF